MRRPAVPGGARRPPDVPAGAPCGRERQGQAVDRRRVAVSSCPRDGSSIGATATAGVTAPASLVSGVRWRSASSGATGTTTRRPTRMVGKPSCPSWYSSQARFLPHP